MFLLFWIERKEEVSIFFSNITPVLDRNFYDKILHDFSFII